jgi:hypothetical protein
MSEKVEVVSVEKSEFFQDPKGRLHPSHMQYCAYCIHNSADRPSCCRRCKTTAKTSDGKIFDDFTKADTYCIRKNTEE